jgi:hypothetical protein
MAPQARIVTGRVAWWWLRVELEVLLIMAQVAQAVLLAVWVILFMQAVLVLLVQATLEVVAVEPVLQVPEEMLLALLAAQAHHRMEVLAVMGKPHPLSEIREVTTEVVAVVEKRPLARTGQEVQAQQA